MIAAPKHGFVFLAAAKSGSTSIERAFGRFAQLLTQTPPKLKHASAREFETWFAPLLDAYGFPRSGYQTVAVMREPLDLVASWWRYRSRPGVPRERSTAHLDFDEFAQEVVAGRGGFRRPADWMSDETGSLLVDRVYKYEHLDLAVDWMAGRIGGAVDLPHLNPSVERELAVSADTRRLLEHHFARELEIHAAAL